MKLKYYFPMFLYISYPPRHMKLGVGVKHGFSPELIAKVWTVALVWSTPQTTEGAYKGWQKRFGKW